MSLKMRKNDQSTGADEIIKTESGSDDIIVQELLDVQAATIGTRKATDRLVYNNVTSNSKQNVLIEKPPCSISVSHLDEKRSASTARRDVIRNDKGTLS